MSKYQHLKTGNLYRKLFHTNIGSTKEGFPETVVYQSVSNGKIYSRPLVEFEEKFKEVEEKLDISNFETNQQGVYRFGNKDELKFLLKKEFRGHIERESYDFCSEINVDELDYDYGLIVTHSIYSQFTMTEYVSIIKGALL